jgi:hypothetical protein
MLRTIGQGDQVPQVVILTLHDPQRARAATRVPVLACADALRAGGATVEQVTATSDAEIDGALKPVEAGEARLVVAAATDAELRGVVRRLVRRYAPPPSKRPAELPPNRTICRRWPCCRWHRRCRRWSVPLPCRASPDRSPPPS